MRSDCISFAYLGVLLTLTVTVNWACAGSRQAPDESASAPAQDESASAPAQDEPPPPQEFERHIRATDPLPPEEERQKLHVPPGFEVQLFAAEPDIGKPINIAFDEKGRLWVTQSYEYPFAAEEGEGSDQITILDDTDGDGRADEVIDFAGGLNIPIGLMPVPGGAVAYSIPYIYRFFDADGDDRSDHRVALYGRFGYERDTHGMVNNMIRGLDGQINVCHGFSNRSVVTAADSGSVVLDGGSTFRIALDGTRLERTTTGRVNPFGLTYDHLGYLYSVDCHSQPIYQLIEGADYPGFGKSPTGIGFGPSMMRHDHGPTAISGGVYYAADHFPPAFQRNFFSGNVVSSRVNRDKIEHQGSTPVARHRDDFVVSEDPWFRPVDIAVGPDGALYIADFYNRIIGHYEVPLDHPGRDRRRGRIWRVVYTGADHGVEAVAPRDDWSAAGVDQLLEDLGHPNLIVRKQAADQLADRVGTEAAEPVEELLRRGEADSLQTAHGLWALYRLDALPPDLLAAAAGHRSRAVRTHALRIAAKYPALDSLRSALVLDGIRDTDPNVRRIAAHAMARHPAEAFVRPLVDLRPHIPEYDTHLEYGVRLSLRNQLRQDHILQNVLAEQWTADESSVLADVMVGVQSAAAGRFLLDHLDRVVESRDDASSYLQHAARFVPESDLERAVAYARTEARGRGFRLQLFEAMQRGLGQRGMAVPESMRRWGEELIGDVLRAPGEKVELLRRAVDVVGALRLDELQPALADLLVDRTADAEARVRALRAMSEMSPQESTERAARLLTDDREGILFRTQIVQAMGASGGDVPPEVLAEVPYDVQVELARLLAGSAPGAEKLMDAVEDGVVPAQLLVDSTVRERLDERESVVLQQRRERLTAQVAPAERELQEIIQERVAGYQAAEARPEDGAEVFATYCASCHEAQEGAGVIAPQMSGIGQRGLESLVVHVLDPNRTVADRFRYETVRLESGEVFRGLLQREEGNLLVFADMAGRERSVAADEVAERTPSSESLMPDNFADTIPEDDFHDLMAYLLSLK